MRVDGLQTGSWGAVCGVRTLWSGSTPCRSDGNAAVCRTGDAFRRQLCIQRPPPARETRALHRTCHRACVGGRRVSRAVPRHSRHAVMPGCLAAAIPRHCTVRETPVPYSAHHQVGARLVVHHACERLIDVERASPCDSRGDASIRPASAHLPFRRPACRSSGAPHRPTTSAPYQIRGATS